VNNPRLRYVLLPRNKVTQRWKGIEMGEKVLLNIKAAADGHRPPTWSYATAVVVFATPYWASF
jgi:hypothetical protein